MLGEILNRGIFASEDGEYFYINKYIPKNVEKIPDSFLYKYFDLIIRYKKGDYKTIILFARILSNIIFNYFKYLDLILPVPPSSSYLDIYPNNILCSYLYAAGLIDYSKDAIICISGRKPAHINGLKTEETVAQSFYIKEKIEIKSKNIILLDDIITTGRTFRFIKQELLKKGANSVTGFFLGKTSYDCGSDKIDGVFNG